MHIPSVNELLAFSETIREVTITIPSFEIVTLLVLLTICLFIRHYRLGLVVAYVFSYRLGWIALARAYGGEVNPYIMLYLVFGLLVLLLCIYTMWYLDI